MRNCLNFIEEDTLLQTNALNMGYIIYYILVNRTPKCHPGISGEGIEYSWGCKNNYYRQLSLDNNKGKKISKKYSKRPYQETTLPQSGFICFLDVHGNI